MLLSLLSRKHWKYYGKQLLKKNLFFGSIFHSHLPNFLVTLRWKMLYWNISSSRSNQFIPLRCGLWFGIELSFFLVTLFFQNSPLSLINSSNENEIWNVFMNLNWKLKLLLVSNSSVENSERKKQLNFPKIKTFLVGKFTLITACGINIACKFSRGLF